MSKKQTRRSISVSRETYERLKLHVEANGGSCSAIVEDLLRPVIGLAPRVVPERAAPKPRVREVVVATPVLEVNGDWEPRPVPVPVRRAEPVVKQADPVLGDQASKIFTF